MHRFVREAGRGRSYIQWMIRNNSVMLLFLWKKGRIYGKIKHIVYGKAKNMGQARKKPVQQLSKYQRLRNRVFDIIEVGYVEDFVGRAYDVMNLGFIVLNLVVSVMLTYDNVTAKYGNLLLSRFFCGRSDPAHVDIEMPVSES